MIRRTASEVLHDLEVRIARLEDSSSSRTASVLDILRSLPRAKEMQEEFRDTLYPNFRNGLAKVIEKKSVNPIRIPEVSGEDRPTVSIVVEGTRFSWQDVSETDLAAGKLLVPYTIGVRMFFRAPKPVSEIVKVKRGLTGIKQFWGYTVTPDDIKERTEVITAVQSFCKKFGVTYSNISFPAADKKSGVYPSMYGTLTVMFDLSHYL